MDRDGRALSDPATLPLPDSGGAAGGSHQQARAARRRLRGHQAQWIVLAAAIATSAMWRDLPPALNPILDVLGVALAVRALLRARAQRAELLAARGPMPTHDVMAAVRWRADPRQELARSCGRAVNWWGLFVVVATGVLILALTIGR